MLIKEMEGLPMVESMVFYPVDPDPTTGKRNKDLLTILEITSTPTLYIKGKKYSGKNAFEFVRRFRVPTTPSPQVPRNQVQMHHQQPQYHHQQPRQQPQYHQQHPPQEEQFNLTADMDGGSGMSAFNPLEGAGSVPQYEDMPRASNTRNPEDMVSVEKALEMAMQQRNYSR